MNSTLSNANFSHSSVLNFEGATLQNVNVTNAILEGSENMSTATVSGAIWSNTTCPDGTNSNNNGNTYAGHF
ncbi:MAG: hypothetical protein ACREHC_07850 [Candidatus Levyibacteriota bacterium]